MIAEPEAPQILRAMFTEQLTHTPLDQRDIDCALPPHPADKPETTLRFDAAGNGAGRVTIAQFNTFHFLNQILTSDPYTVRLNALFERFARRKDRWTSWAELMERFIQRRLRILPVEMGWEREADSAWFDTRNVRHFLDQEIRLIPFDLNTDPDSCWSDTFTAVALRDDDPKPVIYRRLDEGAEVSFEDCSRCTVVAGASDDGMDDGEHFWVGSATESEWFGPFAGTPGDQEHPDPAAEPCSLDNYTFSKDPILRGVADVIYVDGGGNGFSPLNGMPLRLAIGGAE